MSGSDVCSVYSFAFIKKIRIELITQPCNININVDVQLYTNRVGWCECLLINRGLLELPVHRHTRTHTHTPQKLLQLVCVSVIAVTMGRAGVAAGRVTSVT